MDAISDIFRSMHIESVVQVRLEAGAPWGLTQHAPSAKDGPGAHLPEVVHFGMVARGNCWLSVGSSAEPVALIGGDCFLLAPGSSFVLRDHPRTRPRSMCEIIPADKRGLLQYGGEGAVTSLVLGWFKFSEVSLKPLQRLLPQLILVKSEQAHSFALQSAVQMLASEMAEPGPGSVLLVIRLADVPRSVWQCAPCTTALPNPGPWGVLLKRRECRVPLSPQGSKS